MKLWKFLLADFLVLMFTAPGILLLAYYFGDAIEGLFPLLNRYKNGAMMAALALLLLFVILKLARKKVPEKGIRFFF